MNSKRFIVVCFLVAALAALLFTERGTARMAPPGAPQAAAAPQDGAAAKPQETPPAAAGAPAAAATQKTAPFDSAQKQPEADRKSAGCISCHTYDKEYEPYSMHPFGPDNIGCSDCHGGNFEVMRPEGTNRGDRAFEDAKNQAHVQPKFPKLWERNGKYSAGNPERLYTAWNK